ncbi:MAG: LPS export ABC transporter periplasmic protein LptC [Pseudomonadota bacterium]
MARATQASVAGYTRLVRWAKVALPLIALGMIGAIFLIGRGGQESLFTPEELARLGAGMQLENPRFAGATEDGEPFVIRARRALPDGPVPDMIELEAPSGELTARDGVVLEGRADGGRMSRAREELELSGAVVITTSDGYRAETDRLVIDLENRAAASPGEVRATGPEGSLVAGSMEARRVNGEAGAPGRSWIRFENGVRVVFIPEEAR